LSPKRRTSKISGGKAENIPVYLEFQAISRLYFPDAPHEADRWAEHRHPDAYADGLLTVELPASARTKLVDVVQID
jgi:hypothetical protein